MNGSLIDEASATVSIRDTGLLHATGVFTTMLSRGAQVFRLPQHLSRLRESCQALSIPLKYSDSQLTAAVDDLLAKNSLTDARLRLTVTGGAATEDPLHGMRFDPNCFLTAAQFQSYPTELYERGMTVALLDEQKLNPYDIQAGHKTLNYFSRLAALRWARRRAAGEALWFNVHNYLQSGSISNVFLVKSGRLITPPTQAEIDADSSLRHELPYPRSNVLPGITRRAILDSATAINLQIQLTSINVDQLLSADEVFLTNSIMQVMPVCRLEAHVVGSDRPGPVTMQLAESLSKLQNQSPPN
ncbi:MAG TPA: aminotransferase class IV [Tepidisphaeraceae bacterium]|nr:aminotransferase class IV [Tepidisphaeraceae bacterium]